MIIFAVAGLCCGLTGFFTLFMWSQDFLSEENAKSNQSDQSCTLALALIQAAEILIITWLFMRATGVRMGYLLSLILNLYGLYCGYQADIDSIEDEAVDLVFRKTILLAFGFLVFVITGISAS